MTNQPVDNPVEKVGIKLNLTADDPSPMDSDKRKDYAAKVAELHKAILEPKLKQMITAAHVLLEAGENPRDIDMALKGTIYAFRELLLWGEKFTKEQIADATGQNPSSDN